MQKLIWLKRIKTKFKVLSLVQPIQKGVTTLDRKDFSDIGDNMVLKSFDINGSCGGIDNIPSYIGDYAPSSAIFYTDLESTIYSQGKNKWNKYQNLTHINSQKLNNQQWSMDFCFWSVQFDDFKCNKQKLMFC